MNVLLIYNPQAGNGRARHLLQPVLDYCKQAGLNVTLRKTEFSGHAVTLTSKADLSSYDALIASGGDGTLYEVVNGYYLNNSKLKPPIGLIPNGTGNAFMKELGLTKDDWQKAIDIIAGNNIRLIDVARYQADEQIRYFVNVMGTGFVATVGELANKFKWLGNASYTLATLIKIINLKSQKIEVIMDGKAITKHGIFVEIANSRFTGTTFLMAPKAQIDDGKLDIIFLNKTGRLRLLQLFRSIYDGSHINHSEVDYYQVESIKITEETPQPLVPDGEILGKTPVAVQCLQKDLAFIWPEQ